MPTTRRRRISPKMIVGTVLVGLILLFVVFVPIFDNTDPTAIGPDVLQGPSAAHWLGTTQTGEDVFAQLASGGRVSLMVGALAGVIATLIAMVIGILGGYKRGRLDGGLSVLTTVFLVIPGLPLLIVIAGYLPSKGMASVAVVIAITSWATGARSIRAQTLSIRARDYVTAARAGGETRLRIVFFEILVNETTLVTTIFLFTVIAGVLTEAGLSFLGLSSLTTVSWGTMLFFAQNAQALLLGTWWWFIPPGLLIALFGMGLALINFGFDELANPRLRTRRIRADATMAMPAPAAEGTGTAPDGSRQLPGGEAGDTRTGQLDQPAEKPQESVTLRGRRRITAQPVLEIANLSVDYAGGSRAAPAVRDVSFTLHRGELLGLAGESGSGKSTLTNAIARLLRPPGEVTGGTALFHSADGVEPTDIFAMSPAALQKFRWAELSMVFQSAMSSLNPVMRIGSQFDDVLRTHRPQMSRGERSARSMELLRRVSLDPTLVRSYPHELSGGMKQRVAIALALALSPQVVVLDEPTTALDVLVQRQILEELIKLQRQDNFAVIFTTHDLSLLLELCDTIAIMREGRMVEVGSVEEVRHAPQHPYTATLLSSLRDLGVGV